MADPALGGILSRVSPRVKPSRQLTIEEIRKNPIFMRAIEAQRNPVDALTGELGLFANPDGSGSSERSATREVNGIFVNFPTLVRGQSKVAIQRILRGEGTVEDEDLAFNRLLERLRGGLTVPTFSSFDEALTAASARSKNKE